MANAALANAALASAYSELSRQLNNPSLSTVGPYTLGRSIGQGAFGSVRLATHRLTGVRCAIKQIPRASPPPMLIREIHHHRRLHHPHILQLYEVIPTESHIWLVSELCPGGELFDYLVERRFLPPDDARVLFGQLCLALAHLHSLSIVHRDIKLENILLDQYCNVKLADFGFGREADKNKLLDTWCGTTAYASPEMLAGIRYTGPQSDIWSLGVILYALLTGSLPFDDDDEAVVKTRISTLQYEMPQSLDPTAVSLIKSILVLDPHQRPSINEILSHSFFTLPSKNHPSSPSPPLDSELLPVKHMSSSSSTSSFRTPSRTKKRSHPPPDPVIVPDTPSRPSSLAPHPPIDFLSQLSISQPPPLSTDFERNLLKNLGQLGFDTGQITHSVKMEACDSASAIWWMLIKKARDKQEQDGLISSLPLMTSPTESESNLNKVSTSTSTSTTTTTTSTTAITTSPNSGSAVLVSSPPLPPPKPPKPYGDVSAKHPTKPSHERSISVPIHTLQQQQQQRNTSTPQPQPQPQQATKSFEIPVRDEQSAVSDLRPYTSTSHPKTPPLQSLNSNSISITPTPSTPNSTKTKYEKSRSASVNFFHRAKGGLLLSDSSSNTSNIPSATDTTTSNTIPQSKSQNLGGFFNRSPKASPKSSPLPLPPTSASNTTIEENQRNNSNDEDTQSSSNHSKTLLDDNGGFTTPSSDVTATTPNSTHSQYTKEPQQQSNNSNNSNSGNGGIAKNTGRKRHQQTSSFLSAGEPALLVKPRPKPRSKSNLGLFSSFKLWFNDDRRKKRHQQKQQPQSPQSPTLPSKQLQQGEQLPSDTELTRQRSSRLSSPPISRRPSTGSSTRTKRRRSSSLKTNSRPPTVMSAVSTSSTKMNNATPKAPHSQKYPHYHHHQRRRSDSSRGSRTPSETSSRAPSRPVSFQDVSGVNSQHLRHPRRHYTSIEDKSNISSHRRNASISSAGSKTSLVTYRRSLPNVTQVRRISAASSTSLQRRNSALSSSSVNAKSSNTTKKTENNNGNEDGARNFPKISIPSSVRTSFDSSYYDKNDLSNNNEDASSSAIKSSSEESLVNSPVSPKESKQTSNSNSTIFAAHKPFGVSSTLFLLPHHLRRPSSSRPNRFPIRNVFNNHHSGTSNNADNKKQGGSNNYKLSAQGGPDNSSSDWVDEEEEYASGFGQPSIMSGRASCDFPLTRQQQQQQQQPSHRYRHSIDSALPHINSNSNANSTKTSSTGAATLVGLERMPPSSHRHTSNLQNASKSSVNAANNNSNNTSSSASAAGGASQNSAALRRAAVIEEEDEEEYDHPEDDW